LHVAVQNGGHFGYGGSIHWALALHAFLFTLELINLGTINFKSGQLYQFRSCYESQHCWDQM